MSEKREINDDLFDIALKHALMQIADKEDENAEILLEQYQNCPPMPTSKNFQRKMNRILKQSREKDHSERKVILKRILPAIAAGLILVAFIPSPVQASLFDWINWVFSSNSRYISQQDIGRIEQEAAVKILGEADWSYFYFIKHLPQDMPLIALEVSPKTCLMEFSDGKKTIRFKQIQLSPQQSSFSVTYDNEKKSRVIEIDGHNTQLIQNNDLIKISYNNADCYFDFIFESIPKSTAIKIASDLKKFEQ